LASSDFGDRVFKLRIAAPNTHDHVKVLPRSLIGVEKTEGIFKSRRENEKIFGMKGGSKEEGQDFPDSYPKERRTGGGPAFR
jgi:hypothetical protein